MIHVPITHTVGQEFENALDPFEEFFSRCMVWAAIARTRRAAAPQPCEATAQKTPNTDLEPYTVRVLPTSARR